ncbi:MAG: rny [Chloroflexi bacterium]|nr:rny [Chloroflexota bacterium]
MIDIGLIVPAAIGLTGGVGAGVFLARRTKSNGSAEAEAEARRKLVDVEAECGQLRIAAAEEAQAIRAMYEEDAAELRLDLEADAERVQNHEDSLQRKSSAVGQRNRAITDEEEALKGRSREVKDLRAEQLRQLQEVAGLSSDEAREEVLGRLDWEMREEAGRRTRAIINQARLSADENARSAIALAIERLPPDSLAEPSMTVVKLPNAEAKGRVIGREGRNIKALEAATGVEFMLDEAPDVILVNSFDSVKREIARLSLTKLVADGRITPERIEQVVAKAAIDVEAGILRAGGEAAKAAGVHGLHAEILKVFGRLKYRTSYGQNQLKHSVEVSRVARMLASELGADPNIAARAALLHDIGKVMGHEVEGPHHVIGADLTRRFGESDLVADAIVEHHDSDPEDVTVEAVIVQAADAISGARPGARHESPERYTQRIEALEAVAYSFPGVDKTFAIQAGRELRIFVKPDMIDDEGSARLAREVARKVQDTVQYPGEVKVTVVRETSATSVAR